MGKVKQQGEYSSEIKRSSEKIGLVVERENESERKRGMGGTRRGNCLSVEGAGLDIILPPLELWLERSLCNPQQVILLLIPPLHEHCSTS